jgi:hypothetical protein
VPACVTLVAVIRKIYGSMPALLPLFFLYI